MNGEEKREREEGELEIEREGEREGRGREREGDEERGGRPVAGLIPGFTWLKGGTGCP